MAVASKELWASEDVCLLLKNHVIHRPPAGDHRQHVLDVGDLDVEEVWPVGIDHLFQGRHEVGFVADRGPVPAVAFSDGDEVGVALAARFKCAFYFPSPDKPDDSCPPWSPPRRVSLPSLASPKATEPKSKRLWWQVWK